MKNKALKYKNILPSFQALMLVVVLGALFLSCEQWKETAEVSHVSYLPEFEIIGGEFQSFVVVDSAEYVDQGAMAYSNDVELKVYYSGEVDLTQVGVYIITYSAENGDGLLGTAERVVAVTHYNVSENDLSGTYEGTNWLPLVEMDVIKIHSDGYYEAADIMGYSGAKMKGDFVDLGNHELFLVHGEGDFGKFANSEGEYTLSSLNWTIGLIDEPYNGFEIPVVWQRVKD